MKITRPDIVGHLGSKNIRHSIYSVDFQPNGSRLATGGGDSHVRLWSTVALLGSPEEAKEAMLSTLTSHSGSVNVVRWSKDGKYLASGSDDNYVFVYKYSSVSLGPTTFGSSSSAGNKASKCKESWPRCFTLQGHTMDVLDLDWSASGILASASIDNRVLIWDLGFQHASSLQTMGGGKGSLLPSIVAPIKVLSGHQSFVRGVSFDPIMKYLATYGADNTLILWDTETWTESHRAIEPLKEISDRVLFTRLSWAPDGASLCVTSSFKSTKPISAVLKRDSWQSVADLVGHRVETMSCRFLPCIINHSSPTSGKQHEKSTDVSSESGSSQSRTVPSCFVAVGDLEGVLTVWSSSRTRPVLALKEVFGGGVSDIAWTRLPPTTPHAGNGDKGLGSDARVLLCASSIDGQVVLVDLGNELGQPLNQAELDKHYNLLYGSTLQNAQSIERTNILDLISTVSSKSTGDQENSLLTSDLQLSFLQSSPSLSSLEAAAASMQRSTQQPPGTITASADVTPAHILALQKSSHTKSGKKRVCPVTIVAPTTDSDAPDLLAPAPSSNTLLPSLPSSAAPVSITSTEKRVRFDENVSGSGMDDGAAFGDDEPMVELSQPVQGPTAAITSSASVLNGRLGSASTGFQPPIMPSSVPNAPSITQTLTSSSTNSSISGPTRQRTVGSNNGNTAETKGVKTRQLSITIRSDEQVCCIPLPLGPDGRASETASGVHEARSQIHAVVKRASHAISSSVHDCLSPSIHEYIVTAEYVRKPRHLQSQSRIGQESMCRVRLLLGPEVLWESVIMGLVTCLCAQESRASTRSTSFASIGLEHSLGLGLGFASNGSNRQSSSSTQIEGVCVIGCADGSVHMLSLRCGARLDAPFVLGQAIAFVDVEKVNLNVQINKLIGTSLPFVAQVGAFTAQSSSTNEATTFDCRVMACTADGILRVWELIIPHALGAIRFLHKISTSIQPAMQSMKASSVTDKSGAQAADSVSDKSEVTVWLDKCQLDSKGCPVIVLAIGNGNGGAGSGVIGKSVSGGSHQGFRWSEDSQVWLRVADMRHVLSRLFTVSGITDGRENSQTALNPLTMTGLQDYSAKQNGFDLSAVLENASFHSSLGRELMLSSTNVVVPGLNNLSETQATRHWTELVTLSHAEERLCVALSYGSETDTLRWLSEWVFFCCKTNLKSRLTWLVESLASMTESQDSSLSQEGTTAVGGRDRRSIYLLKSIVLPVIERSGCMRTLEADIKRLVDSLH